MNSAKGADVANFLLVVATALTTATVALVIEDLLAKPVWNPQFVWYRGLALLAAILLAFLAVYWRSRVWRNAGTLFYVHLLDERMRDLRTASLTSATKQRMSSRSLVRWSDLDSQTIEGVIDLHQSCHEMGAALETAINTDRDDTGCTIAPNMLWPTALAVGAYLPTSRELRLLELSPSNEHEFELQRGGSGGVDVKCHETVADQSGRVGVWLAFTPMAEKFSTGAFEQFGVETVHVLTAGGSIPSRDNPPNHDGARLKQLAREIAGQLVRVKRDSGNRELVVVAMIPKTVALTVGWHLSQYECRFFQGTHLIHYDYARDVYIPMRVRPSQPSTPPRRSGALHDSQPAE
ncbi:hypothetical protein FHX42_002641 [Saccharopolyspora lacisalsi]|uniref:SMODS-associated and fused to various effectors domain-containing protein n=1 Tax=Halosaccharopolyspora lacisalsi TaxID=1000566 RepID=A0A839DWN5_9PSEU|nr:hypothetical protein [Halosaccharopolyspora lacisalsi]MBA8825290.1 hypothetical protein [Halosaccharopolyspora lacisalsi]